jgi:hypothetical protein
MDTLKQGLLWTGIGLGSGFVAYKRLGKSNDWVGPIALVLAGFAIRQSANCFEAATQDFWQIQGPDQYPQLS